MSQDDTIGLTSQAWEVGSALADGWDVVYDKHYSLDTSDFAPIVTAVLATKPDVVSLNMSYPDFVVQIVEQLYVQGFKGLISANYLDTESLLTKVPPEYIEGAVDSFPLFDDPWWGSNSFQNDFYQEWLKRYGPGGPDDVHRGINGIDWDHVIMLRLWAKGVQLACSFYTQKVLEAMRAQDSIETILGPGKKFGDEMLGFEHILSPPKPTDEACALLEEAQWNTTF